MYKIIGADGKEYGPITREQLQQWLAEGRLNLDSKVQVEGESAWKTLRDLPELTASVTAGPPPLYSSAAASIPSAPLQMVRGPATFILVLAILNILACLWGLVSGNVENQLSEIPNIPPAYLDFLRNIAFLFGVPANIVGLVLAIICVIGSLQMMKLKQYGLAMAAAILMLIPCSGCCCCLNIGAGIWALVVLLKPEVKSAFQQSAYVR